VDEYQHGFNIIHNNADFGSQKYLNFKTDLIGTYDSIDYITSFDVLLYLCKDPNSVKCDYIEKEKD